MTDDLLHRRWDDVIMEIARQVPPAVRSAMVDYRLTVEETSRDVQQLKIVVFGSQPIGVRGLVDRFRAFEEKLDTLLAQLERRDEDWKQMRVFLDHEQERQAIQHVIQRNVGRFNVLVGLFGGFMTIITLLQLFHIISL